MKKQLIIIIFVVLIVVFAAFILQSRKISQNTDVKNNDATVEELGNRFTSLDPVLNSVPDYLGRNSTNDQRNEFTQLAFDSAISTTTIAFSACIPNVVGVKINFDDVLTLSNIGTSSIKLTINKPDIVLSKGESVKVKATDIFPGVKNFDKSKFVKIYSCDGAIGPIGYIVSGK